ncbi:MAG TPA: DNA repair protein RecN [Gemmatimonadaceae bacterium]|nr:DNA repair protein RecN [Gemmatimonadaceae bacterium]
MLTELRIRNIAIIESLTLSLAPGFNVLTGETGAGKSIIVGALGFLLGERGSADLIRTSADRATVEGVFDAEGNEALIAQLDERGIDVAENLVVLKRELSSSGRTRAWINGSVVTAGILAETGRSLVSLHGQHEAQSLLDPESQRLMLDAFAGAAPLSLQVREAAVAAADARREIDALAVRRADAERRADYLRHVVGEISAAKLVPGEEARLEEEARRLENAVELRSLAAGMRRLLEGSDQSVLHQLAQLRRSLSSIQRVDPSLAPLQETFDGAFYALEDLSRAVGDYERQVEDDPARLAQVEQRRDLIYRLTKKYGPTIDAVVQTERRASSELELLDTAHLDLRQLEERRARADAALTQAAAELTARRTTAARTLAAAVVEQLPPLGMTDGRFTIALEPRAEVGETGAEDVTFQVALNVGHGARPLARVASGGELSRVMLALKTILARLDHVSTLVFDEVDAGIGGVVGLQVGGALRTVAAHHQVLAISHLPQIASRAHHHIVVSKGSRSGITSADTRVVEGEERVAEIARMLGGDAESRVSREHAGEMLAGRA